MKISLIECNEKLLNESKQFFLTQGRSDLLYKKSDSLIGAYLISKEFYINGKSEFRFKDGEYSYDGTYFSTSHSNNNLIYALHDKKIAIDIETIKPRSTTLTENIQKLDKTLSIYENFYIQRCSKECLIKYLNLQRIEEIENMKIQNLQKQNKFVGNFHFNYSLTLIYQKKLYSINITLHNNQVIALLY